MRNVCIDGHHGSDSEVNMLSLSPDVLSYESLVMFCVNRLDQTGLPGAGGVKL